jgi:hypothetical protein
MNSLYEFNRKWGLMFVNLAGAFTFGTGLVTSIHASQLHGTSLMRATIIAQSDKGGNVTELQDIAKEATALFGSSALQTGVGAALFCIRGRNDRKG